MGCICWCADRRSEVLPSRTSRASYDVWTLQRLVQSSRVCIYVTSTFLHITVACFLEFHFFPRREKDPQEKLEQFKILLKKLPPENYNNLRCAAIVNVFILHHRLCFSMSATQFACFYCWFGLQIVSATGRRNIFRLALNCMQPSCTSDNALQLHWLAS